MRNVIRHEQPPIAPPPARPGARELLSEARGYRDMVRLALAAPRFRKLPSLRGTGAILIPGWKAPEASMAPMRLFLKRRGCDARHWGLGTNQGDPERDSERLLATVTDFVREHGAPVALVGWSLGGVIAREVARAMPDSVSQVITYGTPVVGGPTYTPAAGSYGDEECERIAGRVIELDRESPIRVPVSAIFSRRDGVVSWPACIDRATPNVVHYEVDSTHLSMGFDPSVWSLVAHRLAGNDLGA